MARGTLIDTWHYAHKAVGARSVDGDGEEEAGEPLVEERKVEIKVRLFKATSPSERPPHVTSAVRLEAECREFGIRVEGTDVEAIRRAVFSRLDETLRIAWREHFLVRVERPHIYDGTGSGAAVSWSTVWKGVAWDGSELMRELGRYEGKTWKVSPWPGAFTQRDGRVMACIPATEANERALREFAAKLDRFRELLGDFLAPDRIDRTLANLSGVPFLPARPDGDDGDADPEPDAGAAQRRIPPPREGTEGEVIDHDIRPRRRASEGNAKCQ